MATDRGRKGKIFGKSQKGAERKFFQKISTPRRRRKGFPPWPGRVGADPGRQGRTAGGVPLSACPGPVCCLRSIMAAAWFRVCGARNRVQRIFPARGYVYIPRRKTRYNAIQAAATLLFAVFRPCALAWRIFAFWGCVYMGKTKRHYSALQRLIMARRRNGYK